ncbi:hypothetical protein [Candidatus Nephthysia bennettiae]|uniref:Uncharacterized protein n=1 Tax=Candidatus Nephthysia bennettiae TaxID=3127016 RepID=A0A934K8C5_9BACT|nr:hypothetical protein [Candidatus Dormibacteraeota bacterium]MBJ7614463.1 hypothetical protein [Candidatus Dormibacteraeota bacterium]
MSRIGDDVTNLYDLTRGNYRVFRAVSYPDHPESLILFDVRVEASTESEWATEITISGTYTGPTDIVATEHYRLTWVAEGGKLLESGASSLARSSGERVRQVWSSIISPGETGKERLPDLRALAAGGQVVNATISPFKIDGARMSYEWEGTVRKQLEEDTHQAR